MNIYDRILFSHKRNTNYGFWIMVFSGYMPSSEIAGSYVSSIFHFLKNLHTVLHSSSINLHSQQCKSFTFFPTPFLAFIVCKYFWWKPFWPIWGDTSLKFWFADIEHLFVCLLAINISSLNNSLFRSSTHFLIFLIYIYIVFRRWFYEPKFLHLFTSKKALKSLRETSAAGDDQQPSHD